MSESPAPPPRVLPLKLPEPTQADAVHEAASVHDQDGPPSLLSYRATYLLLAINILVFFVMSLHGPLPELWRQHRWAALFTEPFTQERLTAFGACSLDQVLGGAWWRLLTSVFVHVTVLHLMINMWCLWNLGLFGEPLLGRPGLIVTYLLTGAAGMIVALGWGVVMGQGVLVAGASGAVFGLCGILIVLLSNRKLSLPWNELRSLRRSIMLFAILNLVLGMAPDWLRLWVPASFLARMGLTAESLTSVSNSAHVGGFVCGLVLGFPLFPRMTSGRSSYRARQRQVFAVGFLLLCLLAYAMKHFAQSQTG